MEQNQELKQRFSDALDSFIVKIKDDKNVIALILQGSMSYDTVWEKSDIDTILVVRDQPLTIRSFCLNEDDIPLNVYLVQRSDLKRYWERSFAGSANHSLITTCKIVYTVDESLYSYLEDLKVVGKDDMAMTLMYLATETASMLEKCIKWLEVKKNNKYCQYWILKTAEAVARMIVCLNFETPNREAVLRAMEIKPDLMKKLYEIPMSGVMSETELKKTINDIEEFLESCIDIYSGPMLDFLADGEIKTLSHIAKHFRTDSHFIYHYLDYLCDKGLVEKVSQTISITPKSRKITEEMAFMRVTTDFLL